MKLNLDCMRDILLHMEDAEYQESLPIQQVYDTLSDYSEDEINYSVLKLIEANFIEAMTCPYDDGVLIVKLDDITYFGHQFLANIRENKIWSATKSVMGKIGATSVQAATQVATSVVTELVKQAILPPI